MEAPPSTWLDTRAAGVLAHVSSLPGDFGIGNLGAGARAFVDFLAEARFRYWQICPIGPTGYGDSPYQLFSGHAGNPYFIDLGELEAHGLLLAGELDGLRALRADRVEYGALYEKFWPMLRRAAERFIASRQDRVPGLGSFAAFRRDNASWLEPFANFMALKAQQGGTPWNRWPERYRRWHPGMRSELPGPAQQEAARHEVYQYLFFGQWERLRRYAGQRGVGIIGDVPIFVALDSADAWQTPEAFQLDTEGQPLAVAGVPPDYFSALGQLWGNPLYNWEYLKSTGYAWWLDRLQAAFHLYDIIRLDHFRGFESYWEIPAGAADARTGRWRPGPGADFLDAVRAAIPAARIIAEDLGYIGPEVVALRRHAGMPGMKILQFAYGHDANNANLPHFYPPNSVAYTGTHDNLTARGWLEALEDPYWSKIDDYYQLHGSRSAWPVIRAALATVSRLAVIPMQDLLDLPADATLNRPGTIEGNWQWRFDRAAVVDLGRRRGATLRHWIELYDRTGARPVRDYSEPPETSTTLSPKPQRHDSARRIAVASGEGGTS